MIAFYTLLLRLATPVLLLRLFLLGYRQRGYRDAWPQRLGLGLPVQAAGPRLWVHAVSVGEVQAALPLIAAVQAKYPALAVLVTTTTPTGAALLRQRLGPRVTHAYLPFDLPGAMRRFLTVVQPLAAIIMETELWPNLLRQCTARGVPVLLANARLSQRSCARYRLAAATTRGMLRSLAAIAAQAETDAGRFIRLGAVPERLAVTGNIKFDVTPGPDPGERVRDWRNRCAAGRPVWIAASTHAGEEAPILTVFARLRVVLPELLLVLVPRHPERARRVAELCERRGFTLARRSLMEYPAARPDIYLVDTLGELSLFYGLADVAFVGGSLQAIGGHNPLEAAALRVPVVTGRHCFNLEGIYRSLIEAGAAWRAEDEDALYERVLALLRDPGLRERAGAAGLAVVEANRGAVHRILGLLEPLLKGAFAAAGVKIRA
ncbi:MAG: lipid IV(A) 3-deoxy-D-manno-octulosonic acid transferase [Gammaproteobacteria bacterium]